MNQQEKQVLQDFLYQLDQARGVVKDQQADEMIASALARQPDAPYLLVQRALLLEQALNNAKVEISALQNKVRHGAQGSSSFLDPNAWGNSGVGRAVPSSQPAPYSGAPYQTPHAMAPDGGGGFIRGGTGGIGALLGTAAATAAGVAGGAFLFHGIGNLLGNQHEGKHHESNGLFGQQEDASAHAAFPGLTRPGEGDAGDASHQESALSSDTSSGLMDDQEGEFFDDLGGDDSLFS